MRGAASVPAGAKGLGETKRVFDNSCRVGTLASSACRVGTLASSACRVGTLASSACKEIAEPGRGDAAAATWIFRGDGVVVSKAVAKPEPTGFEAKPGPTGFDAARPPRREDDVDRADVGVPGRAEDRVARAARRAVDVWVQDARHERDGRRLARVVGGEDDRDLEAARDAGLVGPGRVVVRAEQHAPRVEAVVAGEDADGQRVRLARRLGELAEEPVLAAAARDAGLAPELRRAAPRHLARGARGQRER